MRSEDRPARLLGARDHAQAVPALVAKGDQPLELIFTDRVDPREPLFEALVELARPLRLRPVNGVGQRRDHAALLGERRAELLPAQRDQLALRAHAQRLDLVDRVSQSPRSRLATSPPSHSRAASRESVGWPPTRSSGTP